MRAEKLHDWPPPITSKIILLRQSGGDQERMVNNKCNVGHLRQKLPLRLENDHETLGLGHLPLCTW